MDLLARAALVIAVVIALPRSAAAQLMSPGPLSQAHAAIDGDDHCGDCHQSGKKVVASLCLGCHKDLAKRLDAGAGLHGREYKGKACETCHVEHIGRKTKLVRWPGGAMEKLDHDLTGWKLEGGHRGPKCLDCHKQTQPSGKASFLGAKTACGGCHKDPHDDRFGKDCASCHGVVDWKTVDLDPFDHARTRYPLTGKHAKVDCAKCHGTPSTWKGIEFDTCDRCHADPHKGKLEPTPCADCHDTSGWRTAEKKMRRNHPRLSLRNGHAKVKCETCHDRGIAKSPSKGSQCVDCHRVVHEAKLGTKCGGCHKTIEWLGLPDEIGREAHDKTPFPLAGKHAKVDCARCHSPKLPPDKRFRQLAFDRCAGCHEDVHQGRLVEHGGGACETCHGVDGFTPTTFGVEAHAKTAMPLEGRHAAAPCSGCHKGKRPRLDLSVAKQACADCHANPHGDQFAAEMADGGCAHCHSPRDWGQPRIDHSTWPLTGAHEQTRCDACHGDASGEAARYRGIPRDCEGCHEDTHAGQFRLAAPEKACTRCHDTSRFTIASFDHRAESGFAIEGKHVQVTCDGCHPTASLRNGLSARRYRLGYQACKDCHADPHAQEGGLTADLDCTACHTASGWGVASGAGGDGFDHDRTGFPLRGAHVQSACTGCHDGTREPATTCEGCHRDPHQGRVDGACAECHTATAWDDTATLERHRRSRMPLTGAHAVLDCEACHRRRDERTWSDLPTDCFACHADDYRGDIHPDHDGDAPLPRDCARCHVTAAWSPAVVDPSTIQRRLDGGAPEGHDAVFVVSTGSHADASCASCHVDARRQRRVRCDGCHGASAVRAQHPGTRTGRGAASCLRCHPRGAAR
jgi:hypothetical protein